MNNWIYTLIELVRERPALYNKFNQNYMNKTIKDNNWIDIVNELKKAGFTEVDGKSIGRYQYYNAYCRYY